MARQKIIKTASGIPLEKRLLQLKLPVRRKIVAHAMKKALQPVAGLAIALAPNDTGAIRRHIRVRVRNARTNKEAGFFSDQKYNTPLASVGVMYNSSDDSHAKHRKEHGSVLPYYAHFVELGTHRTAPKPFLGLAWRSLQGGVRRTFAAEISRRIHREAKRKR